MKIFFEKFDGIDEMPGTTHFSDTPQKMIRIKYFSNFDNDKMINMVIERTNKEVIIRLPLNVDTNGLQRLIDYLTYKEATAKSKARQKDVDALASEVKSGWWKKNKSRFVK